MYRPALWLFVVALVAALVGFGLATPAPAPAQLCALGFLVLAAFSFLGNGLYRFLLDTVE